MKVCLRLIFLFQAIHDGTCEDYKLKIQNNENDKLSEEAIEVHH